jgi:hypothetical protein
MRNCIPEVTEAVVIEDFYRNSMTRISSEPYCRKRRPPPNNCFERQTSTSPLTSGPRTSSEVQNLHHRHHGATRTSNLTGTRRRGLVRRYMPSNPPSLEPEVRPVEANGHWMTSSTPSVCTTRTCATPYGTIGTSSTLSDMADRSSLYHLPHHEEGPASLGSLINQKGEGVEHSHVLIGRSTSSSEDTGRRRTEGNRSSTTDRSWQQPQMPSTLSVVGACNNLQPSRSMAQLRPPRQVPAPR